MSGSSTKSVEQHQEQTIQRRPSVRRIAGFILAVTAVALMAVSAAKGIGAQDKYSLKSPSGVPYADFRGYEDWAVVSTAKTDAVIKAIVANPAMIKAYKAGVPGN